MTRITVRVRPGARRSGVVDYDGGVLRINVAAPPSENRANEELINVLAGELKIGRSRIRILRGFTGRQKIVEIDLPPQQIDEWLAGLHATRSPTDPNQ